MDQASLTRHFFSYCIVFELTKVAKACLQDKDFLKMEAGKFVRTVHECCSLYKSNILLLNELGLVARTQHQETRQESTSFCILSSLLV